jgi:PAS domain S-box-containing protein
MSTLYQLTNPLAVVLDAVVDGVTAHDQAGNPIYTNAAAAQLFGCPSTEALLTTPLSQITQYVELYDEQGYSFSPLQLLELGLEGTQKPPLILRLRTNGGIEHWVSVVAKPVFKPDNGIEFIVTTFHDITERKQVEDPLHRERELLQKIFDHIPVMIAMYEPNTKVLQLNREFERLTGWSTEEARQVDFMEKCYPDPEYRAWVRAYMESLSEGWQDILMTTKDGSILQSSWSNIRLTDDTQVGIGIDIRERKRAEAQVRQRLAQLQAIYDLNNAVSRADAPEQVYSIAIDGLMDNLGADRVSILLFDPDGVMRFKAWRGLSDGYRQQTEGHSPWSQDTQNPEPVLVADMEQEPSLAALRDVIVGEGIRALAFIPLVAEGRLLGKFMMYYNQPHQFSEAEVQFAQTLAGHIAFAIEHRVVEQRRVELLQWEHRARIQAEKADALKVQFLAMITHELRTPLTSIKGFASTLLAEDVAFDNETQRQFVATIDEEADKLKDLIEHLIDISRMQAGNLRIDARELSVSSIIDVASAQLQMLTAHHDLYFDIPQNLPFVLADKKRIAQVLVNLVDNAAKYSPPHTRITVSARQAGKFVQIDVSDEGKGIPPDERSSVFEVFYQANRNAPQKGAGLGLAICKGLIEAHEGRIWVDDRIPRGTIVSFILPTVSA